MDMRDVKGNMRLLVILEMDQLLLHLVVFQEGEFIFPHGHALRDTRSFIHFIIGAQAVLVQQLIDHFTAAAAEPGAPRAGFSAVRA